MNDAEMTEDCTMQSDTIHIRRVDLEGLFRQYDHRIELHQEDRVTILHGRNGVGKTITLSLVAALLEGRASKLARYPFKRLRIEFTDGAFVEAMPRVNEKEIQKKSGRHTKKQLLSHKREPIIEIRYAQAGGATKTCKLSASDAREAQTVAQEIPWLVQVNEDAWLDQRNGEYISSDDVVRQYGEGSGLAPKELSEELRELRQICQRVFVHFIEAQRLFKLGTSLRYRSPSLPPNPYAVEEISADMARHIQDIDSKYRTISTQLDDSLPTRLFSTPSNETQILSDELDERTSRLEKERHRLREIGLLEDSKTSFDPRTLDSTRQAMFAVYLEDNEKKLAVFKDLADRAQILLDILNSKFAPKKLQLDKDEGYKVFSHDNQPLKLEWLSSGEQHEIVLLHNLLFRVKAGSLLLIDEPELSLHVTWQTEFLADLIRIAKKVGFDAIVATHSPYIVGSRRDLMVQFGEPV